MCAAASFSAVQAFHHGTCLCYYPKEREWITAHWAQMGILSNGQGRAEWPDPLPHRGHYV